MLADYKYCDCGNGFIWWWEDFKEVSGMMICPCCFDFSKDEIKTCLVCEEKFFEDDITKTDDGFVCENCFEDYKHDHIGELKREYYANLGVK